MTNRNRKRFMELGAEELIDAFLNFLSISKRSMVEKAVSGVDMSSKK
ncbi:hypothetical protein [Vibrio sp. HN007]